MARLHGLILDFDGIFYRFGKATNDIFSASATRAAILHGVPLEYDELFKIFSNARDPHTLTQKWNKQFGLNIEAFHHAHHDGLDVATVVDQNQDAAKVLRGLAAQKIPMVILTHASKRWVERVLKHIGLDHCRDSFIVLALEDVGFNRKADSPHSIIQAGKRLKIPLHKLGMLEDSHPNLVYAHGMGVTTGYVHYGRKTALKPRHVSVQGPNVPNVLKSLGFRVANSHSFG